MFTEFFIIIILLSPGPEINWYLMKQPFTTFDACMQYADTNLSSDIAALPEPPEHATVNVACIPLETETI